MTDTKPQETTPPAPAPEDELDDEELEDENDEELEDEPAPPANETPEQKDARLAAMSERNKKLWARNQRLKKKLAKGPTAAAPVTPTTPVAPVTPAAAPALSKEEAILYAKGFSEEEVAHAQKVAALQGVKLTDAVNDDLFTTWKTKREEETKQSKAQLGASRGSRATVKKTLATPGLSDDEHKALFLEKIGR